jgi:hypothetical protein
MIAATRYTGRRGSVLPDGMVSPGDIIAVKTSGIASVAIELGSLVLGEDAVQNHIAVLHHRDAKGTWWAIEGRPGGVGWRDATGYLTSPYTITNEKQKKTPQQRTVILATMEAMLGTAYDWDAIFEDGVRDLHIPDPWAEKWKGEVAGHVVCSSVAVIAYARAGLAYPSNVDGRHVQPADWVKFIEENHYAL